jgi:hypothetical protein
LQKLLIRSFVALLALAFCLEAAQAKGKRHSARTEPSSQAQTSDLAKPSAERRDPADAALDKKIKSICRGC